MSTYIGSEYHKENARKCFELGRKATLANRQKRIEEYNKTPKLCLQCSRPIDYKRKTTNKFCSKPCSATYTNLKRGSTGPRTGQALENIQRASRKTMLNISPEKRKLNSIKCKETKINRGLIKYPNQKFCIICNIEITRTNKYNYCKNHYIQSEEFQKNIGHYNKNYQKGYIQQISTKKYIFVEFN